jgi:F-type H+-transporting ATPase subunit a
MKLNTAYKSLILLVVAMFSFTPSFASGNNEEEKPFNPVDFAIHHVLDAHEIHFWGEGESSFTLPLPCIVFGSEGMAVFMSSAFHHDDHGHHIVEKNGMNFVKYHEKIYELNAGETHLKYDESKHEAVNAVKPFDLSITKNVATLFLVAFILILVFRKVGNYYKKNGAVAPKKLASWMEPLVVFVRDDIAKGNISNGYQKFMPFLLTVFFFILCGNLLGLIPFLTNPNMTGNISVTCTLAIIMLVIQLIHSKGAFWKHIFMPPGVPVALWPILIPIELAGIFIKPIALTIRLFANITAGHIIIISLISIIFVNQSVAWAGLSVPMALFISVLEILVAFLQAYIFTMLSALFIGMATEEAHH